MLLIRRQGLTSDRDNYLEITLENSTGQPLSHRITLPRPRQEPHLPEDITFLRAKGVFSFPSQEVCEALVHSYFHHNHPWTPIIDAKHFLVNFIESPLKLPLLLTWSVFLAASHVRALHSMHYRLLLLSLVLDGRF